MDAHQSPHSPKDIQTRHADEVVVGKRTDSRMLINGSEAFPDGALVVIFEYCLTLSCQ